MTSSLLLVVLAALIGLVVASPLLLTRQSVSILSSSQVASFKPYTYYAGSAYCQPEKTQSWTCGTNCVNTPTFIPVATGGDGKAIQFWYVGYDQELDAVIVAHQGTDTSELTSVLVNANLALDPLDQELFPGISEDINVHGGFAEAHARAAPDVLAAVVKTMEQFSTKQVTLVGHSLGGALSLLDAVYLPFHLPSDTTFKTITYGMPRVGNAAFADYVDKNLPSVTRINYKRDPVPILPGRFLGFKHTGGEVHVRRDDSAWLACPGQDSLAAGCTIDEVPNLFASSSDDHFGPFDDVKIGCW